jgi:predicted transcriptional regulator
MPRSEVPRPTDAELLVLRALWQLGSGTVRQVHELLAQTRAIGYTTVLKLLQIMLRKGLVRRDESRRTHVYQARYSEEQTQRRLVGDLLDRAFGGSAAKLALHALAARKADPAELAEVRRLLAQLEGGES